MRRRRWRRRASRASRPKRRGWDSHVHSYMIYIYIYIYIHRDSIGYGILYVGFCMWDSIYCYLYMGLYRLWDSICRILSVGLYMLLYIYIYIYGILYVHREFAGLFESAGLSRDSPNGEIGRTPVSGQ